MRGEGDMKRKIVQFRYFEDGKGQVNYTQIDPINNSTLLDSLHVEGKLYTEVSHNIFEVVPVETKLDYSENAKYFYRIQQLNYPPSLYAGNLVSGSAFANCVPIVKLGIQSLPGTRFRFNTNLEWIVLGATGIYELDLKDSAGSIIDLKFDKQSIQNINDNKNAYLIIDIMYEEED